MKKNKRKVAAIDFETFYSTLVSIARMSTYQYVNHPEFLAYLVSIYSPNLEFVGNPENFDWRCLDGYTLVAHNASFDQRVFERLQELGVIPTDIKVEWECTADMCVYYQYQRNLKGAAKAVLGVEMSKEVRDNMKGKTWDDLVAEDASHGTRRSIPTPLRRLPSIPRKRWPSSARSWAYPHPNLSTETASTFCNGMQNTANR